MRNQPSKHTRPLRGVVFTDLDGTLLDHRTYSFAPARAALETLKREGVPLVLCSSKTRAELIRLQKLLGIRGPFISENGGAVFLSGAGDLEALFPDRWAGLPAKVFGTPYDRLRDALVDLREVFGLHLVGFGDVDAERVASWTGLPREQARLACARDFDEPFTWEPEPDTQAQERVRQWLATRDLTLTRGGRFWHLTGSNDKGAAVRWLVATLAELSGERPRSLALGDSENDLPMLEAADQGILVARPGGGHVEPRPTGVGTVAGIGPLGWSRAVLDWLAWLPG